MKEQDYVTASVVISEAQSMFSYVLNEISHSGVSPSRSQTKENEHVAKNSKLNVIKPELLLMKAEVDNQLVNRMLLNALHHGKVQGKVGSIKVTGTNVEGMS